MSRYIATAAIRGANRIVAEADALLQKALQEKGPETPVAFPNTAYFLPTIMGLTGAALRRSATCCRRPAWPRDMLHPVPRTQRWTPYLGETLDSGIATLLAEEAIMGLRFAYGEQPEPLPGFKMGGESFTSPEARRRGRPAAMAISTARSTTFACARGASSSSMAVCRALPPSSAAPSPTRWRCRIVRELQQRNILIFLSGNVNGRSIIHQLQEEGVEMGYDTYIVPFGTDTLSAIYALGFATRSALTFGGLKGGQARDILLYNKARVFAFVLALGEVDDLKYATAAGAISYGFPVIADTVIPQILPTGVTSYEHVISMPFNEIPAAERPGARAEAGAEVHRGARRQGACLQHPHPGALRLGL